MALKLTINQNPELEEPEVIVNCERIDGRIRGLIDTIRQYAVTIPGELGGSLYQVPLETVIYVDSVDKHTFFYDRYRIFRSGKSLAAMEADLKDAQFLRISKNCIINLALVHRVIPWGDRRARVIMAGGECLEVGRTYRSTLLERLRQTEIAPQKGAINCPPSGKEKETGYMERAVRNGGEVLTFHAVPQRVVALSYGLAELVCALGMAEALIAVAPAEDVPAHITARYRAILERVPVLRHRGNGVPALEELRALEPELVIGSWYYS